MRGALVGLTVVALAGCTTYGTSIQNVPGRPVREVPVSRPGFVQGTGPEGSDVVTIADQMMRSLLSSPVVAQADHPPTVVLLEMRNNTRFPINSDLFLNRLRGALNTQAAGRMIFLARDRIDAVQAERALRREQGWTADPNLAQVAPASADYFLTGEMTGLSNMGPAGVEDYILYQFQLIDTESSAMVWEGQYEIQRVGQNDAVYR